jgi:hypothetical protein
MSLKVDYSALLSKLPKINISMDKARSTEASLAAAGVVGAVTAVQLFTDWNPLGRCFTFWKQLRDHVSADRWM